MPSHEMEMLEVVENGIFLLRCPNCLANFGEEGFGCDIRFLLDE
jgi:hypothetical protein